VGGHMHMNVCEREQQLLASLDTSQLKHHNDIYVLA
jgi:hypothetical protein